MNDLQWLVIRCRSQHTRIHMHNTRAHSTNQNDVIRVHQSSTAYPPLTLPILQSLPLLLAHDDGIFLILGIDDLVLEIACLILIFTDEFHVRTVKRVFPIICTYTCIHEESADDNEHVVHTDYIRSVR